MEPFLCEMLPVLHRRHDDGEGLELEALLAEDGVGSKERDDLRQKIDAVPYHIDERPVSTTGSGIGPDPAAAESGSQELEDRSSLWVLADVELGYELPAEPCGRIPLDRDVEASFPVDVSRQVVVQPFLLIDRSRCIVTALVVRERVARDTRCFQHLAEFIDSALCPLSHDVLNPARVPL